MRRAQIALLTVFAAACAWLGPASASVPSVPNSTFPTCLAACPLGDIAFDVIVRDLANNALAGAFVVLDFSQCPGAFICNGLVTDPYTTDLAARKVLRNTDATGKAHFPLRVGGTCGPGTVSLFANGVLFTRYALASPDQNGNGMTSNLFDPNDDALFAAKLGTADPTADFDCDGGLVDTDDQAIFNLHGAHACEGYVDPTVRQSWGSLKSHYH